MALDDNLVAYWKLDETSGTRVDAVGSNDLADNNTVTSTAGKIGNAAVFTASNAEWLSHADNADLSLGDIDFTYALWFFCNDTNITRPLISKWTDSGNQRAMLLQWVASAGPKFWISSNGSNFPAVAWSSMPAVSTWHFCVIWHDASADTINIQVNDATPVSAAHTGGVFDNTADFLIGAYNAATGAFFDGRIDEVGFWKRVLTSQERTELYNSGNGLTSPFPKTLSPGGIASAEAFGASRFDLTALPAAIASAEAFGASRLDLTALPAGIASAEAFGASRLDLTLLPVNIGSLETFGSPTVLLGVTTISPEAIASLETFGTLALLPGAVIISPAAIASAEAFGALRLDLTALVAGIASLLTFGSHTLAPGAVSISPAGIDSQELFGGSTLLIVIALNGIGSAESFGTTSIASVITISPDGLASLEAFGALSVTTGAVVISPAGVVSMLAFGTAGLVYILFQPAAIYGPGAAGTLDGPKASGAIVSPAAAGTVHGE